MLSNFLVIKCYRMKEKYITMVDFYDSITGDLNIHMRYMYLYIWWNPPTRVNIWLTVAIELPLSSLTPQSGVRTAMFVNSWFVFNNKNICVNDSAVNPHI